MGTIVAIGGGELRDGETFAIDKAIVELSGRLNPKLLFIPTASGEAEEYIETVNQVYVGLGCSCETLRLRGERAGSPEIHDKIEGTEIIYVGGGNTSFLVSEWRKLGIDALLQKAWEGGTIISGLSAGAVCWFEKAISDTKKFSGAPEWDYTLLDCLGFIKGNLCPHYDERKTEERFQRFKREHESPFLAIDNNCAMVFDGKDYSIIRSELRKNAFIVSKNKEIRLPATGKVNELFALL